MKKIEVEKVKNFLNTDPKKAIANLFKKKLPAEELLKTLDTKTEIPVKEVQQYLQDTLVTPNEFFILLSKNSSIIECTPKHLKENAYFISSYCKKYGFADLLKCIGLEMLQKNPNNFIQSLSVIDSGILSAFHNFQEEGKHTKLSDWKTANESLKNELGKQYEIFQKTCLAYLSDEKFAMSAVKNDPDGFVCLDGNLRKNKALVLAMIEASLIKETKTVALSKIIASMDDTLKNDPDFLLKLVSLNPFVLDSLLILDGLKDTIKNDSSLHNLLKETKGTSLIGIYDLRTLDLRHFSNRLELSTKSKQNINVLIITNAQFESLEPEELKTILSLIKEKNTRVYMERTIPETNLTQHIKISDSSTAAVKAIVNHLIDAAPKHTSPAIKSIKKERKHHRPPTLDKIGSLLKQDTSHKDNELHKKLVEFLKIAEPSQAIKTISQIGALKTSKDISSNSSPLEKKQVYKK